MKTKSIPSIIVCIISAFSFNLLAENAPSETSDTEAQSSTAQKNDDEKEVRYFGSIIIKNEHIKNQKILSYGTARLENSTFKKSLSCSGSLIVTSCTFHEDVKVSGSLKATQSSFNDDVKVSGSVVLDDCDCKKDLSIDGTLHTIHSKLNNLSISTTELTLDTSTINNIKIRKSGSGLIDQHLYLNNSTVKGDISFESRKGKIHLKGNTQITGKVKGGVIVKEQEPTP